jgi:hypothetical protein
MLNTSVSAGCHLKLCVDNKLHHKNLRAKRGVGDQMETIQTREKKTKQDICIFV